MADREMDLLDEAISNPDQRGRDSYNAVILGDIHAGREPRKLSGLKSPVGGYRGNDDLGSAADAFASFLEAYEQHERYHGCQDAGACERFG